MLRRTFLAAIAALCVARPAFADPGDGDHGRWRDRRGEHGERDGRGQGDRGPSGQGDRRNWGQREWGAGEARAEPNPGGGGWRGEGRGSPDDARAGVRAGRLRPFGEIMGELHGRFGGRLLGQELANEGPRTVYRIRWMTADGRRLDLVVDAQSR